METMIARPLNHLQTRGAGTATAFARGAVPNQLADRTHTDDKTHISVYSSLNGWGDL